MMISFFGRVENTVEKGENAGIGGTPCSHTKGDVLLAVIDHRHT